MTPNEYQREAARTEARQVDAARRITNTQDHLTGLNDVPNDHFTLDAIRLIHGYTGVMNEIAEITGVVQKRYWYGKQMTNEEFRAKIRDEAGDVCWHLMQILSSQGLTFQEVLEANIAKLKARYPDAGWTQQACENRDRVAEAKAQLESELNRAEQYVKEHGHLPLFSQSTEE